MSVTAVPTGIDLGLAEVARTPTCLPAVVACGRGEVGRTSCLLGVGGVGGVTCLLTGPANASPSID